MRRLLLLGAALTMVACGSGLPDKPADRIVTKRAGGTTYVCVLQPTWWGEARMDCEKAPENRPR